MPAFMFVQGYKGDMLLTDYSFLIEHRRSGRRVLFDLGLRKVCTVSRFYLMLQLSTEANARSSFPACRISNTLLSWIKCSKCGNVQLPLHHRKYYVRTV